MGRRRSHKKIFHKGIGYYVIYYPEHPNAQKNGYVLYHRYLMSLHLGREIKPYEHVHHINGDKTDNRLENLVVMHESDHIVLTRRENILPFRQPDGKFISNKLNNGGNGQLALQF